MNDCDTCPTTSDQAVQPPGDTGSADLPDATSPDPKDLYTKGPPNEEDSQPSDGGTDRPRPVPPADAAETAGSQPTTRTEKLMASAEELFSQLRAEIEATIPEIEDTLHLLTTAGGVVELRHRARGHSNPEEKFVRGQFFKTDDDGLKELATEAARLSENPGTEAIWITLNPLLPDTVQKQKGGAKDVDVATRRWLFIDFDPVRAGDQKNASATEDEKEEARRVVDRVRADLKKLGWPDPILADSGNGYHLLYLVDLPADDGGLLHRVLAALNAFVDHAKVIIDPVNANASRVCKLYGTWSRKGPKDPNRPWRKSQVLEKPAELLPVPRELLEQVAAVAPTRPVGTGRASRSDGRLTVPAEDLPDVLDRASKYVAKMPPSIEGNHGHNSLFNAAQALVRGFCLTPEQALPILREYNERAEPPWDEYDLNRKLEQVEEKSRVPFGYLFQPAATPTATAVDAQAGRQEGRAADPLGTRADGDETQEEDKGDPKTACDGNRNGQVLTPDHRPEIHEGESSTAVNNGTVKVGSVGPAADGWPDPTPLNDLPPVEKFPIEVLPDPLARFVRETAAAIGVPTDFVGMALLAVAGAMVGRTRFLRIKGDWDEYPCVYAALVGDSGAAKSPSLKAVLRPVHRINEELHQKYHQELSQYRKEKEEYESAGAKNPALEPVKPVRRRITIDDFTGESLVPILAANPRGLLLAKDELTAWVAAMNQYRGGRGTDRQMFLSIWSGESIQVDRKSNGGESFLVPHPFVGVVGNLTPSQISKLNQGRDDQGDGFVERILFVWPDPVPSLRIDPNNPAVVSEEAGEAWKQVVRRLFSLGFGVDTPGEEEGIPVFFTPEAKKAFFEHYNRQAAEIDDGDLPEDLRGVWSKLRAYAARFTLILHLLKEAVTGKEADQVDADAAVGGWRLVQYLKGHLRRVHREIHAGGDLHRLRALVMWMRRHKVKTFKNGEALKGLSIYRKAEELYKALDVLEQFGYVRKTWPVQTSGAKGGRPASPTYEVNPKWVG